MLLRKKHFSFGLVTAALVCSASIASAAPTVCTVVPSNSTYDATIAVASNFYGPAQSLVADFTATGKPGAGKYIRICQNSTAVLNTEIRTGTSGYSLFLAANAATPNALVGTSYVQTSATSDLYAKGVPVIFGLTSSVPNVGTLIPGLGSGTAATKSGAVTSADAINTTNAQTIAVANPTAAPYGAAAVTILTAMELWDDPIPSYIHTPLYDNIDVTFQSVTAGTNKSGFVSKSQICGGIAPVSPVIYTYIAFTGYLLDQKGILINSGNSTQNALGASLKSFMLSNPSPTYWSTFLSTNCYASI